MLELAFSINSIVIGKHKGTIFASGRDPNSYSNQLYITSEPSRELLGLRLDATGGFLTVLMPAAKSICTKGKLKGEQGRREERGFESKGPIRMKGGIQVNILTVVLASNV